MGMLVNFCAGTNTHILPAKYVDAILVNVPYNGVDEGAFRDTKSRFKWPKTS